MINKRKIIGICLSGMFEQANYDMVQAINKKLTDNGCRSMIFHCCSHFYFELPEEIGESRIYEIMPFDRLDAVIVLEETFHLREIAAKIIRLAEEHRLPVYVIGGKNSGRANFEFDYESGFEAVTRHMIEDHKFRHPIFMGGYPDNEYSNKRLDIFKKVLAENGLDYDEDSMVVYGQFWEKPAARATEEIIKRDQLPDCIICANDAMAIVVCDVLQKHGIGVPGQVAVSGFDGINDVLFCNPQLTTAKCDPDDIAGILVSRILADFNKEENDREFSLTGPFSSGKKKGEIIKIRPALIKLGSCGCDSCVSVNAAGKISEMHVRLMEYMNRDQQLVNIGFHIQNSTGLDEINKCFDADFIKNVALMLTPGTQNAELDDLADMDGNIPDQYYCVYDNKEGKAAADISLFPADEMIPGLEDYLESDIPLTFNIIFINETILGYICMHPTSEGIDNYFLLQQLISNLKIAVMTNQRKRHQELLSNRILELYKTDDLTGLFLRRALKVEYGRLAKIVSAEHKKMAVLLADMDGLKEINDKYGHAEGDKAIRAIAEAIRTSVPEGSACFRYGGDEMLALYMTDKNGRDVAEMVKKRLQEYNEEKPAEYLVSVSVGLVCESRPTEKKLKTLIASADERMYKDKKNNKRLK